MLGEQKEKYKQLGINIAYYRKRQGYSQGELAEQLRISGTHMSRIEGARCAPSLDIVFRICDILSVSPKNLFDFRDGE